MDAKQKQVLIERRLKLYDIKIFELEMDRVAAESVGDNESIGEINRNIEQLRKARAAVSRMMEGDRDGDGSKTAD